MWSGENGTPAQLAPWRLRGAAMVISAICLLALTPCLSSALSARLARGERALLGHSRAVPWLLAQVSMHTPLVVSSQPGDGDHTYWQVGVMAGPEASDTSGMRTRITTQLPQTVAARTTNYYWIGSYLDDGSFVQIRYFVPWSSPDSAGWFYCAFTASGDEGPCEYGPDGSVGANGSTHTYMLAVDTSAGAPTLDGSGQVIWDAVIDGVAVGRFAWTSGDTGDNSPGVYAESSGFAPHAATSELGPVDFPAPVMVRADGQTAYAVAAHLRPVYSAGNVCPPYGARADGQGGVLLGSGLSCPLVSQWLW